MRPWSEGPSFRALLDAHLFVRAVILLSLACVLALVLCQPAHAQIPDQARAYRREYVRIVRSEWGLNAPVASLAAQIHQESGWDCRAVSAVGARGCAQFMPATAEWIAGMDRDLRGGDMFSPRWAFRAQAVYMRWLFDRIRGSPPCERMAFAMSAYNGGLGRVYQRQKLSREPERCFRATCEINPGISAASQRENVQYPVRILEQLEPRYVGLEWGPGACHGDRG